ncbi:MAG: NYN domain-containing protein [Cuniculiplasma sp.]
METNSGRESLGEKRIAIVDGLNIAYSRNDRKARLADIIAVEKTLKRHFDSVEIFIDASARYKIDNNKAMEDLIKKNRIILCPAKISADDVIWVRAASLVENGVNVWIVTNDLFPLGRSQKNGILVGNLTVTIMPSGETYLLERNVKYLEVMNDTEIESQNHLHLAECLNK